MKKKLLVLAIALVLACSLIGTSLALYVKTDSKDVTISTGESITLSFGSTSTLEVTDLSPASGKTSTTYSITLTHAGTGSVSGMAGFFRAVVSDVSDGNLSSVLTISGVEHHEGDEDVVLSSSNITDGKSYLLSDLPYTIDVTFALNTAADGFNFMDYAEESINVTLYWVPFDDTAWYLRLSSDNWLPNNDNILSEHEGSEMKIENVVLAANTELKFSINGSWYGYAKSGEGNAVVDAGDGNLKVTEAGTYSFYVVTTGGNIGETWCSKID